MSEATNVDKDIMSYFPLEKPRASQKAVIQEIDKAFESGKRIVILEAPVGSGKSAVAMTFARKYKDAHIITPRKSLQDQYFEDFEDDVVLMKGRNAYPCTKDAQRGAYMKVIQAVVKGQVKQPAKDEPNCATAPCRNSEAVWRACTAHHGDCPFTVAIQTAQQHHTVVHNIHSFVFQTNFSERFEKRSLMVIDEAHEIEDVLRGFITKKFTLMHTLRPEDIPLCETIDQWCDYFSSPQFLPEVTDLEKQRKEADENFVTNLERYMATVENLRLNSEHYGTDFTVRRTPVFGGHRIIGNNFEFIPHSLGNAANRYLFSYGDKILLMSGTIYDKDQYCRYLGINPEEAYFIRVPSTFPLANRPIYMKPEYQADTSHANWNNNVEDMCEKIKKIMGIFKDVKGLIHVPSYEASQEIARGLADERIVTHEKHDFQDRLRYFFNSPDPLVFVSPVCQQGVDFKQDRARFQIIVRIPYMNTADEFVNKKVQDDFQWYNYKALVVFGQQIGRVNRSDNDFGVTFLMDSRFNKFIAKNTKKLPKWLKDAIVYK